jgi:rhodanese-related sulfurtransferase
MSQPIVQIEPLDAAARLAEGGVVLLDVRTEEEFAAGHAPPAQLLPVHELAGRVGELDASIPVIAICRSGMRSQSAAELLVEQGFDVVNLAGGSLAWEAAGLELIAEDGTPGQVT